MARFNIFIDRAGQYRWRLVASNGEIVANSEAYTTKYSAKRSAQRVKELAASATVDEV
ncbi:MAG: hypothetical protein ACD_57C00162G0003 [uncultured bacterium]|nr:MAG: hypothetical protein ACD_57C00162G0003 [uncultured bacterium]